MAFSRLDVIDKNIEWFSRDGAVFGYDSVAEACQYRGDQDAYSAFKCGIGVCIPDDLYHPGYEGLSPCEFKDEAEELAVLFDLECFENIRGNRGYDLPFLNFIQNLHDDAAMDRSQTVADFVSQLQDLREKIANGSI